MAALARIAPPSKNRPPPSTFRCRPVASACACSSGERWSGGKLRFAARHSAAVPSNSRNTFAGLLPAAPDASRRRGASGMAASVAAVGPAAAPASKPEPELAPAPAPTPAPAAAPAPAPAPAPARVRKASFSTAAMVWARAVATTLRWLLTTAVGSPAACSVSVAALNSTATDATWLP